MDEVKDNSRFSRGGLFAKYVMSLVGLVVFVLAVNGAMETWINYRATRTSLTTGMADNRKMTMANVYGARGQRLVLLTRGSGFAAGRASRKPR